MLEILPNIRIAWFWNALVSFGTMGCAESVRACFGISSSCSENEHSCQIAQSSTFFQSKLAITIKLSCLNVQTGTLLAFLDLPLCRSFHFSNGYVTPSQKLDALQRRSCIATACDPLLVTSPPLSKICSAGGWL